MAKLFNVAGPCNQEDHYMLPSENRCTDLNILVDQKQFFVLHAARQTGKTTLVRYFIRELNQGEKYHALYCSLEILDKIGEAEKTIPELSRSFLNDIRKSSLPNFEQGEELIRKSSYSFQFSTLLSEYCRTLDRPLVVFFDEADCLSNGALISFLRQLRQGYVERSDVPFVHSLALVGMRNIRDYKNRIRSSKETLGSASPFNIVTEALTLSNFTESETADLYAQHTQETAQGFPSEAVRRVFECTQGQPWLTNAIARQITQKILANDFKRKITPDHVDQAAQILIERRDTHIDSLLERLQEERVRKVVEPVITGEGIEANYLDDDFRYVLDLGLMKNDLGVVKPANPIYAEVIMRALSYDSQCRLDVSLQGKFIRDGELDCSALLKEFLEFWRENSEIWTGKYQYKEAAPHLILQAYFQRVLNLGGDIHREYASGRGRIDLYVELNENRYPIELKIRYGKKTKGLGLKQIEKYMDQLGCKEGWLIIFDRRKISWEEKLTWETETVGEKIIHVIGC